jgi:hypothetical protein
MTRVPVPIWLNALEEAFEDRPQDGAEQTRLQDRFKSDCAAAGVLMTISAWKRGEDGPRKSRPSSWHFVGAEHEAAIAPWFSDWPNGFVDELAARTGHGERFRRHSLFKPKRFPALQAAIRGKALEMA